MKSWSGKDNVKNNYAVTIFSCIFFAGVSSVAPFFSVHMRSLGLSSVKDAVFVHSASGLACCILPLFVVSISGRKFILCLFCKQQQKENVSANSQRSLSKWCICGCLVVSAAFHASLLTVPREVWVPRQPLMDFDCGASFADVAALRVEKCVNWDTCRDIAYAWPKGTRFRVSHCRQRCPLSSPSNTTMSTLLHPLHVCFRKLTDTSNSKTGRNSKNLCRVHDTQLPDSPMLEFEADLKDWRFSEFRNVSIREFLLLDPRVPHYSLDVCAFTPSNSLWVHDEAYDAITCRPAPMDPSCSLQCLLSAIPGENKPKLGYSKVEACYEVVGDHYQTFWLYICLRATADALTTSLVSLLDAHLLNTGSTNYGRRLVWPALSMSLTSPAVGMLIDYCGEWAQTKPNYSPGFLIACGLFLISCAIGVLIPPPPPEQASSRYSFTCSSRDVNMPFWWTYNEALFVILASMFLGSFWGFSQVYSPWLYQQELGFNHWMLGAVETLCFGCSLPLLMLSPQLMRNIGEAQILATAFAFHGLRLLGLSFLTTDGAQWWWPLPFEAMRAMALPLGWIALCRRGSRALADDSNDLLAVLHCILNILHFGAGRLMGVVSGGFLSETFGFSLTLRIFGAIALIWAFGSLVIHHWYFRSLHRNKMSVSQREHIESVLSIGSRLDLRMIQWSTLNGGNSLLNAASAEEEDIGDIRAEQAQPQRHRGSRQHGRSSRQESIEI